MIAQIRNSLCINEVCCSVISSVPWRFSWARSTTLVAFERSGYCLLEKHRLYEQVITLLFLIDISKCCEKFASQAPVGIQCRDPGPVVWRQRGQDVQRWFCGCKPRCANPGVTCVRTCLLSAGTLGMSLARASCSVQGPSLSGTFPIALCPFPPPEFSCTIS